MSYKEKTRRSLSSLWNLYSGKNKHPHTENSGYWQDKTDKDATKLENGITKIFEMHYLAR